MEVASAAPERGVDRDTENRILARLYGEPLESCPEGLYIPPDALRVFLESFEGPLDLLLYLIRRQKFNVMDIPMAELTEQYMRYVEMVRASDLELAAAYLVMSATLMQIKSRLLLPAREEESGEEEDPRAELMRRLLEYEKIREGAKALDALPRLGRDFFLPAPDVPGPDAALLPVLTPQDLSEAWRGVLARLKLSARHKVTRQELSVREHMTAVLRRISAEGRVSLRGLIAGSADREVIAVWFLALLELAKDGLVTLTQAEPFTDIWAEAGSVSELPLPPSAEDFALGGLFAQPRS
jgi:segregation and condensation protein A